MAVKLKSTKANIEVIAHIDSAIGPDVDQDGYKAYLESFKPGSTRGNEELLKLAEEPTRFILRGGLPYDSLVAVKEKQVKYKDGVAEFQVSYTLEELRLSLVGINNPAGVAPEDAIEFKRDSNGHATKELIAMLEEAGIATDLWTARKNAVETEDKLKKSRGPARAAEHDGSEAGEAVSV